MEEKERDLERQHHQQWKEELRRELTAEIKAELKKEWEEAAKLQVTANNKPKQTSPQRSGSDKPSPTTSSQSSHRSTQSSQHRSRDGSGSNARRRHRSREPSSHHNSAETMNAGARPKQTADDRRHRQPSTSRTATSETEPAVAISMTISKSANYNHRGPTRSRTEHRHEQFRRFTDNNKYTYTKNNFEQRDGYGRGGQTTRTEDVRATSTEIRKRIRSPQGNQKRSTPGEDGQLIQHEIVTAPVQPIPRHDDQNQAVNEATAETKPQERATCQEVGLAPPTASNSVENGTFGLIPITELKKPTYEELLAKVRKWEEAKNIAHPQEKTTGEAGCQVWPSYDGGLRLDVTRSKGHHPIYWEASLRGWTLRCPDVIEPKHVIIEQVTTYSHSPTMDDGPLRRLEDALEGMTLSPRQALLARSPTPPPSLDVYFDGMQALPDASKPEDPEDVGQQQEMDVEEAAAALPNIVCASPEELENDIVMQANDGDSVMNILETSVKDYMLED